MSIVWELDLSRREEFLFYSKKRLQKELEQSQKHNQEMKNEIIDIKMQMKHQQKILEALYVSQNISLSDL